MREKPLENRDLNREMSCINGDRMMKMRLKKRRVEELKRTVKKVKITVKNR